MERKNESDSIVVAVVDCQRWIWPKKNQTTIKYFVRSSNNFYRLLYKLKSEIVEFYMWKCIKRSLFKYYSWYGKKLYFIFEIKVYWGQ